MKLPEKPGKHARRNQDLRSRNLEKKVMRDDTKIDCLKRLETPEDSKSYQRGYRYGKRNPWGIGANDVEFYRTHIRAFKLRGLKTTPQKKAWLDGFVDGSKEKE